mmetsp:Transcript_68112/g.134419  ORF Transcript_68112/g.134419 Transcript_68112/m.134419 type:complete len:849 (+) Transcript_68112:76-2622(+)
MLLLKAIFLCFAWQDNTALGSRLEEGDVAEKKTAGCIDVNRATTVKLTRARGIGMSLAYRIVRARTCLLKDFDDLRNKLQAQQHPEGLWTFDRRVAPLFHNHPPALCVNCELDPDRAKSPWKQKIIDVNVASFSRMLRAPGLGKGMAYRILMARSCFFTSYPNFEARFRATPTNSNLWKFVQDAIDAGEICIKDAPSISGPVDEENGDESQDVELISPESNEQEVQASIVVHNIAIQADRTDTKEIGVQTDIPQTREIGTNTDGGMPTEPRTREVQTQTNPLEQAVQDIVVRKVGRDFLPSQVTCSIGTQDDEMDIEYPESNPRNEINVNIWVNVAFVDMVHVVKNAVQSPDFLQQVQRMLEANRGVHKRGQVVVAPASFDSMPVYEDSSQIKDDFWKLMGICGTYRNDFVGYENRPDWQVLPFTSKICRAHGCREAMTQFAQAYGRTCNMLDKQCREAGLWVSMLFSGSAACGDLLMAEKMHEDLQVPLSACSEIAGGYCTIQCVHALRDFPGLERGCRSADCTRAYVQLENMYSAISNCPEPNVGNAFPINVYPTDLVMVGQQNECVLAPLSGGWVQFQDAQNLIYCSYFRPISEPSGDAYKLVDPRTNLCLGWLHQVQHGQALVISDTERPSLGPCNMHMPGYGFQVFWKNQGSQICVVLDIGQVTNLCLNTKSGPNEVLNHVSTGIGQVSGVSKMNFKKGSKLVSSAWTFPWPPASQSHLFRFEHGDQCLVMPPNSGWGMISEDLEYCTYFTPTGIPGQSGPFGKFKDPRSGKCVGWIHQDGFPGSLTIPGANGLATGPCGESAGDRMGEQMEFNTVFQHFQDQQKVCIMTNSGELTPYCFTLS